MGLKHKAESLGAEFIDGEVVNFEWSKHINLEMIGIEKGKYESPEKLIVKMNDGTVKSITFGLCVIAAGANCNEIAHVLKIGRKGVAGLRSIPLPLAPR